MKKGVLHISKGFRLVIYSLVMFFMFLAILDGYENHQFSYDNIERIDEVEFDILDITHQITRPGFRKVSKFERVQIFSDLAVILKSIAQKPTYSFQIKAYFAFGYTLKKHFLANSIRTNAP
jgi:hypothetical protein